MHARQLSEQDRLGDEPEDEDASLELNEEVREIRRLMEKEEARRAAWKLQREKRKRAAKPPEPRRESGPGPEPDNPWGVSGM